MAALLPKALLYTLAPMGAAIVGGTIAAFRTPSPNVRSSIQHFAAGVVFAALGVEILPDVVHHRAPIAAIIGFVLGTAVMLGLKSGTQKLSEKGERKSKFPVGLLTAIAVDIALDGLLIGVGFAAGAKAGLLLTIALTLELLSVGLAVAAELGQAGVERGKSISIIASLTLLIAGGAAAGVLVFAGARSDLLEATLAFGSAALLFLVTEELLVEAHEVPETPFTTATFFAGFLLILVLDMLA